MSQYRTIVQTFGKIGYREESQLSEVELNRVLDRLRSQNMGQGEFDRSVSSELWEETPKQPNGGVLLREYIETIVKGQTILENEIETTQKQLQRWEDHTEEKQNLQQDLASYTEDYKYLTLPFNLPMKPWIRESRVSGVGTDRASNSTVIFGQNTAKSGGSGLDLKVVQGLSIIGSCLQLIVMFHKHHFLSLMCFLLIFGIFNLSYFDPPYIKLVLITLTISILFDLAWLIVQAQHFWNVSAETQHGTIQGDFLRLLVALVAILMILKLIIGGALFKYRDSKNIRRDFHFLGTQYQLNSNQPSIITTLSQ